MFLIVINAAIQKHLSPGFGELPRACLINHQTATCMLCPLGEGSLLTHSIQEMRLEQ